MGRAFSIYEPKYVFSLVDEFYDRFFKFDVSDHHKYSKHHWWGCTIILHVGPTSATISIIHSTGNQTLRSIEEHNTKVGPNCTITCDQKIHDVMIIVMFILPAAG